MECRDDFRKILKIFEEFPDKLFADSIETTTFVTSKSIISQIFKTISHENKCN